MRLCSWVLVLGKCELSGYPITIDVGTTKVITAAFSTIFAHVTFISLGICWQALLVGCSLA